MLNAQKQNYTHHFRWLSRCSVATNPWLTVALALGSYLLFFLVLFRFFHGFSVSSFGRLWHFFVSYADFGLARRALIGTLVSSTPLASFLSEYQVAYGLHLAVVALLVVIVTILCISGRRKLCAYEAFIIFYSPAFVVYQGYNTGSLDLYLILLAIFMVFGPFVVHLSTSPFVSSWAALFMRPSCSCLPFLSVSALSLFARSAMSRGVLGCSFYCLLCVLSFLQSI